MSSLTIASRLTRREAVRTKQIVHDCNRHIIKQAERRAKLERLPIAIALIGDTLPFSYALGGLMN